MVWYWVPLTHFFFFLSQIGMRSPTVLGLLAQVFEAHVACVADELKTKTTNARTTVAMRVTLALDRAGDRTAWQALVHRALRELHVAAALSPADLADDAARITTTVLAVARQMAPTRAAAVHAISVQGAGAGVHRLRAVMARGVARRAMDNLTSAVGGAASSELANAIEALTKAPEAVWERFITAADATTLCALKNATGREVPDSVMTKAVLQAPCVRQAWLHVVTAITAGHGTYQPATSFVHPYLCFVREFVRLRIELHRKLCDEARQR